MSYPIFDRGKQPFLPQDLSMGEQAAKEEAVQKPKVDRKQRNLELENLKKELESKKEALLKESALKSLEGSKEFRSLTRSFDYNIDPVQAVALTSLSYSATQTGYEGWQMHSAVSLYSQIFSVLQGGKGIFSEEKTLPGSIQNAMNQLQESIALSADQIAGRIAKLNPGESFVMEGGWTGVPSGHAMIYRFEKTKEGSYNIYLYNAQKGSGGMQGAEEAGFRKRTAPYLFFKSVAFEELFFCKEGETLNPIIFENLWYNKKHGYESAQNAVYDSFFHLKHRLALPNQQSKKFISMQRSGNCTVKALNCLTLDLVSDYAAYKKVALDVRLLTLAAAYQSFKKNGPSKAFQDEKRDTQIFQLKEACGNFLRVLGANFKKNVGISKEQYIKACATVKEIQNDLVSIEETLSKSVGEAHPVKAEYDLKAEQETSKQRLEYAKKLPRDLKARYIPSPAIFTALHPNLGKDATWRNAGDILGALLDVIGSLEKEKKAQEAVLQAEATFKNLSHLKSQSVDDKLGLKDLSLLQERIAGIQEKYHQLTERVGDTASLAMQNTGMELLALSYKVAVAIDEKQGYGVLKDFAIDTSYFFDSARKDELFALQDHSLLLQRQNLEEFFRELGPKPQLFALLNSLVDKNGFLGGKTPEGALYKRYNAIPGISEALLKRLREKNNEDYDRGFHIPETPMHAAFHHFSESRFSVILPHLTDLRKSAIYACALQGVGKERDATRYEGEPNITYQFYSDHFSITCSNKEWVTKQQGFYQAGGLDFSRTGDPKSIFARYAYDRQSFHKNLDSENQEIIKLGEKHDKILPFYAALAEPDVQIGALIQATIENLDQLKDSGFRKMLLHMFVKNIESKERMASPFLSSLQEPSALKRFEHLISFAKKMFVDAEAKGAPRFKEMLFAVRLYARALQQTRQVDPKWKISKETQDVVKGLLSFLDDAKDLKSLEDDQKQDLKKEIRAAKIGLLLGIPLGELSSAELSDLVIDGANFKSEFEVLSKSEDPSFIRECKRRLFYLQDQWTAALSEQKFLDEFANTCLEKALEQKDLHLTWAFDQRSTHLSATDRFGEQWWIDLLTPSIRNTSGALKSVSKELESTDSFKRLFKEGRFDFKVFGVGTASETRFFTSPVWGEVKVIGNGKGAEIQKKIESAWYTYIPHEGRHETGLQLNDALFGDHALFVNLEKPEDIRFYDLETGKELYHTENGKIYHNQTGKVFYQLDQRRTNWNKFTALSRFDTLRQVNGWIDEKLLGEGSVNDWLEFNRFNSNESKKRLSFEWSLEKEVWEYSENKEFHIDTGPDLHIGFQVDHFLSLVSHDGSKRKILVPVQDLSSRGYSPLANIKRPDSLANGTALDSQKGSMRFFEYDLDGSGMLIGKTPEEKMYLAHLYLAQKHYGKAKEVLGSISISEKFSKNAFKELQKLLGSSQRLHDFSPNAVACHLQAYLLANGRDPFVWFSAEEIRRLARDYYIYIDGLNKLEELLILDKEQELQLINYLMPDLIVRNSCYPRLVSNTDLEEIADVVRKREAFLKEGILESKVYALQIPQIMLEKVRPELPDIDERYENTTIRHFKNYYFETFASIYNELKTQKGIDSLKTQGIVFRLLFEKKHWELNLNHQQMQALLLAAYCPKEVPELPSLSGGNVLGNFFVWHEDLKCVYQRRAEELASLSNQNFSRPKAQVAGTRKEQVPAFSFEKSISKETFSTLPVIEEGLDARFEAWQKEYLAESKKMPEPPSATASSKIPLDGMEGSYKIAIENHHLHYLNDCRAAYANEEKKLKFKEALKDQSYQDLISKMQQASDASLKKEQELLKNIRLLAGKTPTKELLSFAKDEAERIGLARKAPPLETILRAASQSNRTEALQRLNRHLSNEEATTLAAMAVELMIEATDRRHLERVFKPLEKWLESKKQNAPNQTFFEQAEEAMSERRTYNPVDRQFALLFEYLSNIRVRAKQAHIINDVVKVILEGKDEQVSSRAFQLIMAGGKTSVIISMLVELIAESGSTPYVMCHHSQLASVKGNLVSFQNKRFDKDVILFDYTIKDLGNYEMLKLMLKRLHEARVKKLPIVMKTTFPQVIELKFILESLKLSSISSPSEKECQQDIVEKLAEINQKFHKEGVGIYDECDINLSILLDVNIPLGESKNVSTERASLVKTIYENLLKPEIKGLVGLDKNLQSELSSEDLKGRVLPFLAKRVFSDASLRLDKDKEESFSRYVQDKISFEDQKLAKECLQSPEIAEKRQSELQGESKENVAFLIDLYKKFHSEDRYETESANLIALTRQILCKVLKTALSRSFNRNYGRDPVKDDGRVIPYLAVGTPATTKFGNIYISLAYQFQSALNGGIPKGEISFLAEKMTEAARHYARKENQAFLETAEAVQFKELTGVGLEDVLSDEGLNRAEAYVNDPNHLERRLALEAEVAPFHVYYQNERATSNPVNNVSQFKKAVACSGTLWNHQTYHRSLKNPNLDAGTEGSIINLLALRNAPIHEVKDLTIESFFDLIKNHPNKKALKAIVDGGGLLRDYTNETLAFELKNFFLKEKAAGGPDIQAVVYLHKFSEDEVQQGYPKESFVALQLDDKEHRPVVLRNTTNEELAKHGLKNDRLFVLFDELRATGTDIELADDALFLCTSDHKMLMRTALQGALRARKLFKDQRGEFVVTSKGRKEMIGGGKTFADLQKTWEKNEAIALQDQTNRARLSQIDDVVRSSLVESLLAMPKDGRFEQEILKLNNFFVSKYEDSPYLQGGEISGQGKALEVLKDYAGKLLKKLDMSGFTEQKQVVTKMQKLLEEFEKEISEDEQMSLGTGDDLDAEMEQEVAVEVELELEQETEVEVSQEILTELQDYSYLDTSSPYKEAAWNLSARKPLWEQIAKEVLAVPDALGRRHFGQKQMPASVEQYAACFPSSLKMTGNFYHTVAQDLPLLHPLTKKARFALIMKDDRGGQQTVLVSEKDASFFKSWLQENRWANAHLVDLRGFPEVNADSFYKEFGENSKALIQGLCYAHLLNGNIDYLEEHKKEAAAIIGKNRDILTRFLYLKVLSSEGKEGLSKLSAGSLFDFSKAIVEKGRTGVLFSGRRRLVEAKYREIQRLTQKEIAELAEEDVPEISRYQVPWLVTKAQVKNLPDNLVNALTLDQITKGLLPEDKIKFLTKKELIEALLNINPKAVKLLANNQVDYVLPKQVPELENNQLSVLTNKDLIAEVSKDRVGFLAVSSRKHIGKAECLFALPDAQGLEDSQLKELSNYLSQIDEKELKPWHVPYLHENQIPTLTRSELISAIPLKYASKITIEQAKLLTKAQSELVPHLQYPVFKAVDKTLYEALTHEQIGKLNENDAAVIAELTPEQMDYLNGEALQKIPEKVIEKLSSAAVQRLKDLNLLMHLDKRIAHATDEQKKIVAEELNKRIRNGGMNLKDVKDLYLQFVEFSESEIQEFSIDKLPWLKAGSWKHLSNAQLQDVQNKAPASLTKERTEELSKELLASLHPDYLKWLSRDQIKLLDGKNDITVIQALPSDLVKHLSKDALQCIKQEQLVGLKFELEKFEEIEEPELLFEADEEPFYDWMTEKQLAILTKYIDQMPVADAGRFKARHVPFVTAETPALEGIEDPDMLVRLREDALRALKPSQVALIQNKHRLPTRIFNILYPPPSNFARIARAALQTLVMFPQVVVQFLFNFVLLFLTSFPAIFSAGWRGRFGKRAKETFVNAPRRALAAPLLFTSYERYKRRTLELEREERK